jgi:hypothetical protein
MTDPQHDPSEARWYPAQKARQGEIVLKTSLQRTIFIAGLVGVVFVALALNFLR